MPQWVIIGIKGLASEDVTQHLIDWNKVRRILNIAELYYFYYSLFFWGKTKILEAIKTEEVM